MVVIILDRVFQSDNVMIHVMVHPVDHTGQTGGFARTRRPRHEEQSSRTLDQIPNHRRQAQLFKGQELVRNSPQNHSDHAALLKDGHSKSSLVSKRKTKVRSPAFLELLLVSLRSNTLHQVGRVFGVEYSSFQTHHVTTRANYGRLTHCDVQVAHSLFDHRLKQLINLKRTH